MMNCVCFFPFTHMDGAQVEAVTAFFPETCFLQLGLDMPEICLAYARRGLIRPASVSREQIRESEVRLKAYLDWADLHRGNERNLKSLIRETVYFKDDNGPASIRNQVRQAASSDPHLSAGAPERVTDNRWGGEKEALLFLKLAEMLDRENETIQKELRALDAGNAALFAELKGELPEPEIADARDAAPGAGQNTGMESGVTMVGQRMSAWFEAAQLAGIPVSGEGKTLYVTTSQTVFDYLESNADQVINGLDIECVKVHEDGCACKEKWQKKLIELLEQILLSNAPTKETFLESGHCCASAGQLKLSLFSGETLKGNLNFPGKRLAVCLVKLNS